MKKRRLIFLALLVLGIGAMLASWFWPPGLTRYQGKSIQAWALQLGRGREQPRAEAAAAFAAMGPAAIPELVRLLNTDDSFLRKTAWRLLPKLPIPARQFIIKHVHEPDAFLTRESAAIALGTYGPKAAPAIPALIAALAVRESRIAADAADALGRIGKASVAPLTIALQNPDWFTRFRAAYALGRVGPDAAPTAPLLAQCLRDDKVRDLAAYALWEIGPASVPVLLDCLASELPLVREKAALALGEIGEEASPALPALRKLAEADETPTARKAAKEAIAKIAGE